jgi:hypothetical protein
MRRREFIAGLGGTALLSVVARAQRAVQMRRVGYLTALAENSPVFRDSTVILREGLSKAGWVEGRNLRLSYSDLRFGPMTIRSSAPFSWPRR